MTNDLIPFYDDGDELTGTATADITGKRFVVISGDKQDDGTFSVAPAAVGDLPIGVSMWDAVSGKRVTIETIESGMVVPITAGAALAAGDSVVPDATGQAVAAAPGAGTIAHCFGRVLTAAAAAGDDAMILLSNHSITG